MTGRLAASNDQTIGFWIGRLCRVWNRLARKNQDIALANCVFHLIPLWLRDAGLSRPPPADALRQAPAPSFAFRFVSDLDGPDRRLVARICVARLPIRRAEVHAFTGNGGCRCRACAGSSCLIDLSRLLRMVSTCFPFVRCPVSAPGAKAFRLVAIHKDDRFHHQLHPRDPQRHRQCGDRGCRDGRAGVVGADHSAA